MGNPVQDVADSIERTFNETISNMRNKFAEAKQELDYAENDLISKRAVFNNKLEGVEEISDAILDNISQFLSEIGKMIKLFVRLLNAGASIASLMVYFVPAFAILFVVAKISQVL